MSHIITVLIDGWRDIDSNVRKTSIKMIQYVGSLGISLSDCNLPLFLHLDQLRLLSEVSDLMSLPEYPDKTILQDFILWNSKRIQQASY